MTKPILQEDALRQLDAVKRRIEALERRATGANWEALNVFEFTPDGIYYEQYDSSSNPLWYIVVTDMAGAEFVARKDGVAVWSEYFGIYFNEDYMTLIASANFVLLPPGKMPVGWRPLVDTVVTVHETLDFGDSGPNGADSFPLTVRADGGITVDLVTGGLPTLFSDTSGLGINMNGISYRIDDMGI